MLRNVPSVKIVSSNLNRAIETEQEIAEITKIEIIAYQDGPKERYYVDYRLSTKPDGIPLMPKKQHHLKKGL